MSETCEAKGPFCENSLMTWVFGRFWWKCLRKYWFLWKFFAKIFSSTKFSRKYLGFFPPKICLRQAQMREAVWNNCYVYKKCNAFRKNFPENRENCENKNVRTISAKNYNFVKIHEISQFREIKRPFCFNPTFRCKQMKKVMKCHIQYNRVENLKSVIYFEKVEEKMRKKLQRKGFLNRATKNFFKFKNWCVMKTFVLQ